MNDRYLYRAKRKNWRELPKEKWWVEGYYAYMQPYHYIMPKDNFDSWIEIDEKTLCACTGLKDKNGKLIWENDIVRYTDMITGVEKIDRIEWNETHASFVRLHRSQMGLQYLNIDEFIASGCEVIGSAVDNAELLEVGE